MNKPDTFNIYIYIYKERERGWGRGGRWILYISLYLLSPPPPKIK
jgi:hypothetical protein